jgi:hypothetical protein
MAIKTKKTVLKDVSKKRKDVSLFIVIFKLNFIEFISTMNYQPAHWPFPVRQVLLIPTSPRLGFKASADDSTSELGGLEFQMTGFSG